MVKNVFWREITGRTRVRTTDGVRLQNLKLAPMNKNGKDCCFTLLLRSTIDLIDVVQKL